MYEKYYFELHNADGNYNDVEDTTGSAVYRKHKKLAKQMSGISPDEWADRFYNLQDLTSHDDVHLSKEAMLLIAQKMAEHVSGEGKRITWDTMLDYLSFASIDRSSGKKSGGGNRARKVRGRFMAALKKTFDLTNIESDFSYISKKDKTHGIHIVDSKRFHDFVEKRLHWDLTEAEVKEVLREIALRGSRGGTVSDVVDENVLRNFVSNLTSRRAAKDKDDVIVDVIVGRNQPDDSTGVYKAVLLCRDDERRHDEYLNLHASRTGYGIYVWVLKRKDIKGVRFDAYGEKNSAGTTRLMPIVDIRLEAERVDSALVAAGYTCCTSLDSQTGNLDNSMSISKVTRKNVDKNRYLWIRRATNHVEARDHALVDLVARRGAFSDRRDKMHAAPGDKDTWFEVMGRQQHAMKLQMRRTSVAFFIWNDDIKLWGNRVESSKWSTLGDRISKVIALNAPGKEMSFMRELEMAIRFGLRQKNHRRGDMVDDLTEAVDAAALFNEHTKASSSTMQAKLDLVGWRKVLKSCGLHVEKKDEELLFRRLSRESSVSRVEGIERPDFISFISKTEFELEETAFHLKEELQRRHQLKNANPRIKRRHVERLRNMFLRACKTHDSRRGDTSMKKTTSSLMLYDGLAMEHFSLMLKCINEYLTEAEQHRLVLRFDPDFRGSVNVDKLIDFVSSEHDAPRERAERVLLASQTMAEFVGECREHGDGSKESQAWNLLIDERRHRRKLPKKQSGLLACFSSDGPEEILDPEDLSIAVERRGAHTAGIRGALRLSDFESRRLAMFMAPKNAAGKVSKEEFSSFFRKPTKPLGEILDILIKPMHFGTIVDGYKKWFASEFNDKQLRLDYQTLRDEKVRFIAEQAWNRFIPPDADQSARPSDPSVGLEALFNIDWSCDENQSGENPFTSPSEVALVALHVGADDQRLEGAAAHRAAQRGARS